MEPDTPGTGLSGATCGGGVRGTISSLLFTNFLMGKIPEALNERMNADLFYTRCCIPGRRIERYHNLIFAGRQVNEIWAILPFAKSVHDELPGNPALKELCDWIMTQRARDADLRPYCKAQEYVRLKRRLEAKYGCYLPSHGAYALAKLPVKFTLQLELGRGPRVCEACQNASQNHMKSASAA